jgi:signal transduction histidine kinase
LLPSPIAPKMNGFMKPKTGLPKFIELAKPLVTSKVVMSFGISLILATVSLNTDLYRVEAFFYDLRMRWKGNEPAHPEIMLMYLREKKSVESPVLEDNLDSHLKVLEQVVKRRPKAIVYLNKFDPVDIETKPAVADKFVALAQEAESQGTRVYFGTDIDLSGEVLPPYPLSLLPHFPATLHKDEPIFAEDKVMRRALLTVLKEPTIHMRVAFPEMTREELLEKAKFVRGSYYYGPAKERFMMIRFPQSTATAQGAFPAIEFSNALEGKDLDGVEGKILLVHSMRKEEINDYVFTPYSRMVYTNPRVLMHASILDTLLKNKGIVPVRPAVDAVLTFMLALVLAFTAITMSPSRGVAALISLSGALFLSSLILFRYGYWLPLVHPLLAMFFTYYLIVPYRAILEYKKRWEVQEKHDLLVQVEELKGNFLSLMSHDLKTPVARIQGLAEMVLRQGGLLPAQEDEIRQIISSTENLDKFISKILNLTKVESNEIKLNKKSKDINKIIEQCVQKLEFQAKAKEIGVELNLDPLFPIQVDASLMIQVFTNMIDNAIKYSPPGAKVTISSREASDFVEVTIEDTGTGLSEQEQQQLFTKFFRGSAIPGDQVKGSGLGLYLSKYFIELHNGSVQATSQKGSGSKFMIQLPIEGDTV